MADALLRIEAVTRDIVAELVVQDGSLRKVAPEVDGDKVEEWSFLFGRLDLSCTL